MNTRASRTGSGRFASLVCAWVMLTHFVTILAGASPRPAAGASPPTPRPLVSNRAELEAFMDGVMAAQIETHHLAGAAVAVVGNGQILLAKGYGFADIAKAKRVDPARTLFRIGSVSKLFTWTAVMQLVEQGKLDLSKDVNTYLKSMRVPATFPEPISLAHLMAHTAGFEDSVVGLFANSADRLRPLQEILSEGLPARVRPPGLLASYSNHGTALAGLIVQDVSGIPWESYVESRIMAPLGMKHATPRQPLPPPLQDDMSAGYEYSAGEHHARPFEFVPLAPAGSVSAGAADMGQFMLAHLQNGRLGTARILSEQTAVAMRGRLFTHDPRLNGMLHGFIDMSSHGEEIAGHGGDTFWFHTVLMLLPKSNVGLFASYNSDAGSRGRDELVAAFLNRYFPAASVPPPAPDPGFRRHAGRYLGRYAPTRVSHTSLAKLSLLMTAVRVELTEGGRLATRGTSHEPTLWVEQEPMLFRDLRGQDLLAFRQDDHGEVTHMFLSSSPSIAFERIPLWNTPPFHFAAAGICALLLLTGLIFWPILAVRNRGKAPRGLPSPLSAACGVAGRFGSGRFSRGPGLVPGRATPDRVRRSSRVGAATLSADRRAGPERGHDRLHGAGMAQALLAPGGSAALHPCDIRRGRSALLAGLLELAGLPVLTLPPEDGAKQVLDLRRLISSFGLLKVPVQWHRVCGGPDSPKANRDRRRDPRPRHFPALRHR